MFVRNIQKWENKNRTTEGTDVESRMDEQEEKRECAAGY